MAVVGAFIGDYLHEYFKENGMLPTLGMTISRRVI